MIALDGARRAVEDALSVDDACPDYIVRTVLASFLDPSSLEPFVIAGAKSLQDFEEGPIPYAAGAIYIFQDMVRAILSEQAA